MPKILSKSKKTLLITLSVCLLLVCLISANYLSSFLIGVESSASQFSAPSFEVYFLSLSKSQIKNEALSICSDYQKIGAGGYVWENEGYFHIISSGYLNQNDATLVQNSLKHDGINSEIFPVKFKSFAISGSFDNDEGKIINRALNCVYENYKELYDISVSLDTNVYNEISARLAINDAHNNLASIIDNYQLLFSQTENQVLKSFEKMLLKVKETSQKLCGATPLNNTQTYPSLIKYRYIEMLRIYFDFLNVE